MNWKRLFLFFIALIISASAYAQQLTPQLRALLDFYFRGPGASNTITTVQIRDGAVTKEKLDQSDIASLFALRSWVSEQISALDFVTPGDVGGLEGDPEWNAEKSQYALRLDVPSLEEDPDWNSEKASYYDTSPMLDFFDTNPTLSFFTGNVDFPSTWTNIRFEVENGSIRNIIVTP